MSILAELRTPDSGFGEKDVDWLHLLVGDWQLIADLSFADLVLWVPRKRATAVAVSSDGDDGEVDFVVAAQCRPMTGLTMFSSDAVGDRPAPRHRALLSRAYRTRTTVIADDDGTRFARADVVPVVRAGRVLGVLTRHTEESRRVGASRLERNYRSSASALLDMIGEGSFPHPDAPSRSRRGEPRVGDGLILLNREGRIRYASPNGVSVLYRLGSEGDIEGRYLADLVADLVDQPGTVDESLPLVLTGRTSWRSEVESGRVNISLRSIPLMRDGNRTGAVILCRDVSEIRRRERELMSRDALIREMHHRVKNNLQTVSALLRLQARRATSSEAKSAIEEAMRRVSVIAVVHDSLSQSLDDSLDFDDILDKGLRLAPDLSSPLVQVTTRRVGSFGKIATEDASALLLAITELVTNAVEHGYPFDVDDPDSEPVTGRIDVRPEREGDFLRLRVVDDGAGLNGDRGPGDGLGTQIVRTLITADLRGTIEWRPARGGGTEVVLEVPLRPAAD
ncbi:sensor histidine kinase [Brevibacterium yomogidense]|uniref:sensor histidine kinase n=1 Tax=Brevibacterium yomogidense TaxID=946573 RepID=UPI0018DFCED5|nr:histidine kinase N-terminal domain-containing protein [Brevibacterium yomogidense]